MVKTEVIVRRYDADEGLVFDWADPHYHIDENGEEVRDHLYARTLYLSPIDDIMNYVEVEEPKED